MNKNRRPRWVGLLVVLLTALAATTLTITFGPDDNGRRTVTVRLSPTDKLPVKPAISEFDSNTAGGLEPSAGSEIPGVSDKAEAELKQDNQETIDEQTYDTSGVLKGAAAEPARITCITPQHGAKRSLSRIGLGVVHVTVGRNTVGTGDVRGLCSFFRRVKASPTWTVDNEANSSINVPLNYAPWTQSWYNSVSCSVEFIGSTGRPGEGPAQWTDVQIREGARLFYQCFKKAGIPIRKGATNGAGRVTRTGMTTHQELGRLGGGHRDPGPYFSMPRLLSYMRMYAGQPAPRRITSTDRTTCRKLNWWRAHGRPHGLAERRAVKRKAALTRRHVTCTRRGARRGRS